MSLLSFVIFAWCSAALQGKIIVYSAPFYVTFPTAQIKKIKMNTEGIFKGKNNLKRTVYSFTLCIGDECYFVSYFFFFPGFSFLPFCFLSVFCFYFIVAESTTQVSPLALLLSHCTFSPLLTCFP